MNNSAVSLSESTLEVKIIRCGCGDPDSHNGARGPATVCPKPRAVEDKGVISYWHRNPLKRWAWRLRLFVRRMRQWKSQNS